MIESTLYPCALCGRAPALTHHGLGCEIACLECYDPGDCDGVGSRPAGVAAGTEAEAIAHWSSWVVDACLVEDDGVARIAQLVEEHFPCGCAEEALDESMPAILSECAELADFAVLNRDGVEAALVTRHGRWLETREAA